MLVHDRHCHKARLHMRNKSQPHLTHHNGADATVVLLQSHSAAGQHPGHGRHFGTDDLVDKLDGAVTAGPAALKSCLQVLKGEAARHSCRAAGKPFHHLLEYPVSE